MSLVLTLASPTDSAPPLPAFVNVEGCWALFNWNPVGYAEGQCVAGAVDGASSFLGAEPYENNWATLAGGNQDITEWLDSSGNSNTQSPRGTAPVLDVTNKQIVFDSTGGLRSGASPVSSTTKTFYVLFRLDNLGVTGYILFTIGDVGTTDGAIDLIRVGSGTVRVRVKLPLSTASVQCTVPDTNWHLICITYDSKNATVADQLKIYLDNVEGTTNVDDLAAQASFEDLMYVGGSNAETWRFVGKMRMIRVNNQVDSPAVRAAMYARVQYLQSVT